MIYDKIKLLREQKGLTQAELARKLGLTRAGVNAWEMGLSMPSTQYIVELARFFNVSTDYLLDMPRSASISVEGLNDQEISSLLAVIECYRQRKR
ncbi:MAG: helix-turn-helix transcriptional regulator [Clostridia bacterium]|nr:helix-turn-helix transcriptional regulator [Clostridia bacterium]